ncbi:uncharacterized protein LY79DRAFT_370296 [Colletotrichum navitas]|uniref:Uncharacterized protein n=1 Tax=Colletotrichum navitas TaxID=681940 RepID=A0AAD8V1E3_9PEZI|nr:uncharacterized protein LY79DRAFT_370296 [Colletotrichum navitas]KAK1574229.1 hypothetical protein LY79DRAFT_370296 [Colletotrichum navitas]
MWQAAWTINDCKIRLDWRGATLRYATLRLGFRVQDRDGCATTSGWRQAMQRWTSPAGRKLEANTSGNIALASRFEAGRLAGAMNWRISRNIQTMHAVTCRQVTFAFTTSRFWGMRGDAAEQHVLRRCTEYCLGNWPMSNLIAWSGCRFIL